MFSAKQWQTALAAGGATLLGSSLALAQVAAPPASPQNEAAKNQPTPRAVERDRAQPNRAADQRQPADAQRNPAAERTDRPADRPGERADRRDQDRRDQNNRQEENRRPGLGIQFDPQAQGGLTVTGIEQGSIAAEAGLKSGDRIVTVDGRQITRPRQFQAYLSGQAGRELPIVVNRGGQQQTIYLTAANQNEKTAWLGVFLNDNADNQRGAMVMQVYPAGPAARAGLWPRDVITHVNGKEVEGSADLIAAIEEQEAGSKAELSVQRNNQEVKLTALLGSRDQFLFRGQDDDDSGRRESGRQERGRGGSSFEDDAFSNIPPHAMQLEHDRRMAEQHERLESQMAKLTEEVRQLRELIQQQRR